MTRINLGINPSKLCDQHLLAEHREMKRIPNVMLSGRFSWKGIPSHFTLNTGHVKFFYNKLDMLHLRYSRIYDECVNRAFKVSYYGNSFLDANNLFHSRNVLYEVTQRDVDLITKRLHDKLLNMKNIRYYGKLITSEEAISLIINQ